MQRHLYIQKGNKSLQKIIPKKLYINHQGSFSYHQIQTITIITILQSHKDTCDTKQKRKIEIQILYFIIVYGIFLHNSIVPTLHRQSKAKLGTKGIGMAGEDIINFFCAVWIKGRIRKQNEEAWRGGCDKFHVCNCSGEGYGCDQLQATGLP